MKLYKVEIMEIETIGKLLVDLVKISIFDTLYNKETLKKEQFLEKLPNFSKMGATFVTITKDGNLRGCIGSLVPHTTLFDDLTTNAKKAAFEDPRFPPLTKEEFEQIKVEISIIGPITKVAYNSFDDLRTKIVPNEHGVILRLGKHQGTFLPQVWEQLADFDSFMVHLFHKAGLDPAKVEETPEVFVYTVDKIAEQ